MKKLVLLLALVTLVGAVVALSVPSPTKAVGNDPGSYLCWNHDMVNPVAYDDTVADEMWKTGKYLEPQAILGNVVDGTNIGAYHLVCNAPSTLKMTETSLGGSGEVYSAVDTAAFHKDHWAGGNNDLNVYHIYK